MLCRQCGGDIEPGARFCPACGNPVTAGSCASCGAALAPEARFCASCGAPVEAAIDESTRADTARERKIATLLFADLVGFTALNETHDPEVIESVVGRAFERLSAEVARYEGLVEKFAGDAILAVFGVPAVHEDDPERAVRAALEMQMAMAELRNQLDAEGRPGLALRIGIETGEVLSNSRRAANERDRMVTGDAVNTAARLEQSATAGEVVVGPGTYAATRESIEYEELEPIALKGKALPVPSWRAVRVKAGRGGRRGVIGLEAPLIGRDEELALLKETVRRTASEGRPHLVTVLGSAGVGKSRLTWELEKYLDGLPDIFHWRKGRCLAYAQTSYSALADAIAVDASVLDDDSTEAVDAKLTTRMADLAEGRALGTVEAGARVLVGLASAGGLARDELFDAWRGYLELIARRAPLVLVLEDIHWADEGLLDFVEFLARWAEAPIMILCLARHELLERRPAWGGGLPNATSIVLEPLGPAESQALVSGLLDGPLPAELGQRVAETSEGNPLFAEELVRLFVDRGVVRRTAHGWEQAQSVATIEIPRSIQALLAARLDSLPADEKRLSQDAAVVGRVFWDRILSHLAGQSPSSTVALLRSLRVKELVVPRESSSLSDAQEYAFRHVLIRDVAYDSLPKLERARKHREVAVWAEERLGDRADEVVELLAAHYWSALRYEEEFATGGNGLNDLRRRTLDYARAAGHRALDVGQFESATQWMRIVIEQSDKLQTPVREHAELVLDYLQVTELYEIYETRLAATVDALDRMASVEEQSDEDRRLVARLRQWQAYLAYAAALGSVEEVKGMIAAGLEALGDLPPCGERAALLHRLGWLAWRTGPPDEAIAPLQRALEEARAAGSPRVERWAKHDLGLAMTRGGPTPEGLALIEQSMELAREANDVSLLMRCYINLSATLMTYGDEARAIAMCEEGIARARRASDRHSIYWLANNLAQVFADLGRLTEADQLHREAIAAAAGIGLSHGAEAEYSLTLFHQGRDREAREMMADARTADWSGEPQMLGMLSMVEALVMWETDPRQSIAGLRAALTGMREARIAEDLGKAAGLLIRMAVRIGDADAVSTGIEAVRAWSTMVSTPVARVVVAWHAALADADAGAGAKQVAAAAEQLVSIGHVREAADAYADAAWLAHRAGLDPTAWSARSAELYAQTSAVPVLGPMRETNDR